MPLHEFEMIVTAEHVSEEVSRFEVPGGWIYRFGGKGGWSCYVPFPAPTIIGEPLKFDLQSFDIAEPIRRSIMASIPGWPRTVPDDLTG